MVTNSGGRWVLLVYRIAREPTAGRVGVWRKLKRLGAVLLHDSAWVLPATPRTVEQFRWLAAEIRELGGEAMLWEAMPCLDGQGEALVEQFMAQVDVPYREILDELGHVEPDLAGLSKRYQQVRARDYFSSPLGREAREALLAAGGGVQP